MISQTDIEDMTDVQDEARATVKPEYPVKPLDLSNLIRLAILHGRGYRCAPETRKQVRHLTEDDQAAIMSFDPEGLPCFDRLDDLVAATWKGHLARPSQAGDERVARLVSSVEEALQKEINGEWFTAEVNGKPLINQGETEFVRRKEADRILDVMRANVLSALAAMDTPKGGGDE